jgi:hypothetical protein
MRERFMDIPYSRGDRAFRDQGAAYGRALKSAGQRGSNGRINSASGV